MNVTPVLQRYRSVSYTHLDVYKRQIPVCVGQGTRVAEYLINKPKKYRAEITFGIRTDTFDAGGEILERNRGVRLELTDVIDALEEFKGEIKQVPPMISACLLYTSSLQRHRSPSVCLLYTSRCV